MARDGWAVELVERDPIPDLADGDDAFVLWERRSVPQWRFVHVFASRTRSLLLERAPDVLERLSREGSGELNYVR